MNIMVFNVPAETVGALSILNEFYYEIKTGQDKSVNWIFVLSKPYLEETDNIKVLRFPWIKKSWLHRLYFDNVIAPKLIHKYSIDKVISFQNVIVPNTKISQTLYVHNSLPFVDYYFSFKENRNLWIYQNVIGRKIEKSIKLADKVIVQAEWMKKACIEKTGIKNEKVDVLSPQIGIDIYEFFSPNEKSLTTFFYPASGFIYKNHKLIVESCKKLKSESITNFRVLFTLNGNENEYITDLYNEVKNMNLPIVFTGNLTREQVFNLYKKSVLLFPSYIESYGLPMLEAKLHKDIIIASDCPFSHEILDEYENAYFFNPFVETELVDLMKKVLTNEIKYANLTNHVKTKIEDGWNKLIKELLIE